MKVTFSAAVIVLAGSAAWAGSVGWRTDGSGRYSDAEPPIKWSADENIVWKTPMPSWSNSTPVIAGDRLFVCSEPTDLVCVNVVDGEILWRKPNGYDQTVPPDKYAEFQNKAAQADATNKKLRAARGKLGRIKKKLRKAPDDAALIAQRTQLQAEVTKLAEQFKPLAEYVTPVTHEVNGYSTHTPVSDGKHVWVATGLGTVACYDLAGERKWIKLIQKPVNGYGNSTSPVLVEGKLIVHFGDMIALDAAKGNELWRAKVKINGFWGTPAVAAVGETKVVITPNGDAVRVNDGGLLARRMGRLQYGSPVVSDGVVYFVQHGGGAVKLPERVGEKFIAERLWRATKIKEDRYYASSLVHDGLIYAITRYGVLSVLDASDGATVYSRKRRLKRKEEVYPSIALAGKYIYVSSDSGTTIVMEPGRAYKEVATNQLETFRSCPVFVGSRMYIRGYKNLYCIGK